MVKPLTKKELQEIKSFLERLYVGQGQADRFLKLVDRVTENIKGEQNVLSKTSKPVK